MTGVAVPAVAVTGAACTAVHALSVQGLALALRLGGDLNAHVYAPERLAEGAPGVLPFVSLSELMARTFASYPRHVFVGATGIAVRAIAPHLVSKASDPAVAVIDLAGRFAVSLVSGHAGGANELARELARLTGAMAVITTGTDVAGLPGVDELAAAKGMAVANPQAVKAVSAALLEGRPVQLFDPEGRLLGGEDAGGLLAATHPDAWDAAAPGVWCHWRAGGEFPMTFRVYPRCLCLGLGCRKGVDAREILAHVAQVLAQASLAQESIAAVGTATIKRDDPGLCAAAAALGPEIVFFEPEALAGVEAAGQSETVRRRTGTGSVCEAAALLLSGADELLATKTKTPNVTCAVALKTVPGSAQGLETKLGGISCKTR
ncbi:MAG: cobalamin biosynthesis protein [Humidesulfovibrio sp.]|uniref:cobalt-precorrin 5A hydrolase n=1 Tax=Humidesulfovibrio sp. TaxID=2910988 RepID=UPI00273757D1|nr:cobalamin biosynthesis protein [Humidesulfovibrio sp.]MDP2847838.1 cobalamin biosynthesis protein [Humidesulfovibrio sp.]